MSHNQQDRSVLLLGMHDGIGGVARIMVNLAHEFRARNRSVQTVFPGTKEVGPLLDWCRYQGVDAQIGPESLHVFVPRNLRRMRALTRFVKDSGAGIVNLHYGAIYISPKDILAVRMAGVRRCVVSLHGGLPWNPSSDRRQMRMTKLAARLCHAVVVVTAWSRGLIQEAGVPADKITVIPCGLQSPLHVPERGEARARLGIPEDAFAVVTAARLSPEKGLDDLIEAVGQMPDLAGNLRLVISGDGPERESLGELAERSAPGRVLFLGHQNEVAYVYASADVFCLASLTENCGMVHREAAFFGLPCVGTNVGGNPETILDGKTGLIVPPQNPAALAGALRRLRDDPDLRRCFGNAARERARTEFTSGAMADRYEKVFGF
jgi:glycosyltransferase involved in cell wall biosynthesis